MGLKRFLRTLCLGGPKSLAKDDAVIRSSCVLGSQCSTAPHGTHGIRYRRDSQGGGGADPIRSSAGGADYDHMSCYLNPLSGSTDDESGSLGECAGEDSFVFRPRPSMLRGSAGSKDPAPCAPRTPAQCPTISFRRNCIDQAQQSASSQPHHQQQQQQLERCTLRAAKSCELHAWASRACPKQTRHAASDGGAGVERPAPPASSLLQPLHQQSPTRAAQHEQPEARKRLEFPGASAGVGAPVGSAAAVPAETDCQEVCWVVARPSKAAAAGQGEVQTQGCAEHNEHARRAEPAMQPSAPEEVVVEEQGQGPDPAIVESLADATSVPLRRASRAVVAGLQSELAGLLRRPDAALLMQSMQLSEDLISGLAVLTVSASLTSFLSRASSVFLPCAPTPSGSPPLPPAAPEPQPQGVLPAACGSGFHAAGATAAGGKAAACSTAGLRMTRPIARHACILAANGAAAGLARVVPVIGALQPTARVGAPLASAFAAASAIAAAALDSMEGAASSVAATASSQGAYGGGMAAGGGRAAAATDVGDEVASDVSTWRPLRERYLRAAAARAAS